MRREYKYYVYILTNYTKNVLYIGFTNDIVRRIIEHKNGFGSKFTARYKVGYLIHYEEAENVYSAIGREKELKRWSRDKKMRLIRGGNPGLADLSGKLLRDAGIGREEMDVIVRELKDRYDNAVD